MVVSFDYRAIVLSGRVASMYDDDPHVRGLENVALHRLGTLERGVPGEGERQRDSERLNQKRA
jgi:hypothetical protein